MAKRNKQSKKDENEPLQPVIVNRVPGFSSQFKEDLGWWFKHDRKKRYDPALCEAVRQSVGRVPRLEGPVEPFRVSFRATQGARECVPRQAVKILDMVTAVMQYPFQGIGKPEPLKYMDGNIWSRRIDLEHRLIYKVNQSQIDFLACRFHYQ